MVSRTSNMDAPITALLDDLVVKYSNMSFETSCAVQYELYLAKPKGTATVFTIPDNVRQDAIFDWLWEHRNTELRQTIKFKRTSALSSSAATAGAASSSCGGNNNHDIKLVSGINNNNNNNSRVGASTHQQSQLIDIVVDRTNLQQQQSSDPADIVVLPPTTSTTSLSSAKVHHSSCNNDASTSLSPIKRGTTTTTTACVISGCGATTPTTATNAAEQQQQQQQQQLVRWSEEIRAPMTQIVQIVQQLQQQPSKGGKQLVVEVASNGKNINQEIILQQSLLTNSQQLLHWMERIKQYAAIPAATTAETTTAAATPTTEQVNLQDTFNAVISQFAIQNHNALTPMTMLLSSSSTHSTSLLSSSSSHSYSTNSAVIAEPLLLPTLLPPCSIETRYDAAVPAIIHILKNTAASLSKDSNSNNKSSLQQIIVHLIEYVLKLRQQTPTTTGVNNNKGATTSSSTPSTETTMSSTSYNSHTSNHSSTSNSLVKLQLRVHAGTKSNIDVAYRRSDTEEEEDVATSTTTTSDSTGTTIEDASYVRFVIRDTKTSATTPKSTRPRVVTEEDDDAGHGMTVGLAIASKLIRLLGSHLVVAPCPTGAGADYYFDLTLQSSGSSETTPTTPEADVARLTKELRNVTILYVGDVSHGEIALTALARVGIDIVQVDTSQELLVLIESKTAIDPHRVYMCLMQENLYNAETFRILASVARSVLLTFGPHRLVRDGKRHFVSLDRTLPSLILEAMVECLTIATSKHNNSNNNQKSSSALSSNKGGGRRSSSKPPRPTRRSLSEGGSSTDLSHPPASSSNNNNSTNSSYSSNTKREPPPNPRALNFDWSAVKVLIAEDNRINQKVLIRMLKRLGLKDIDVVDNGLKAVEHCRASTYDVVFVDHQMPIMDGLEACRAIKQQQQTPNPVIVVNNDDDDDDDGGPAIVFVTANTTEEFRKNAYLAGGTGFITKPFDIRAIEAYFKTQTKLCRTRSSPPHHSSTQRSRTNAL